MRYQSFEELKDTGKLPSPSGVGVAILRATQKEDCSAAEIAAILQADPALTGRILQLANSATAGGSVPVTTLSEATVRLGIRTVRSVALGFSLVASHKSGACTAFDYERCWAESLARALAAQTLSTWLRVGSPAEVFVCALLSRIGELALATAHPEEYAQILTRNNHDTPRMRGAEREQFGIDHAEVRSCLLRDWGLPEKLWNALVAIDNHSVKSSDPTRPKPGLNEILQVAVYIARAFVDRKDQPDELDEVNALLGRFQRWDAERLEALWDDVAAEWRRWGKLLQIETCLVPRLCRGPGASSPVDSGAETESSDSILLVSSNPDTIKTVAGALAGEGYQLMMAAPERAIQLAMSGVPRVVIAELEGPASPALQFCRLLRSSRAGMDMFLMVAATADTWENHDAAQDIADDLLTTPIVPRILRSRVRAGIRMTRMREETEETSRKVVAALGVRNRKLLHESVTDALTGLPNRRFANEELRRLWQQGCPMSVVIADIDHFKSFNDRYGHDVGDLVLQEAAKALQGALRGTDTVCRFGGEEFLVIHSLTQPIARACAERLRAAVEEHRVSTPTFTGNVTASFGVAERTEAMKGPEDLLKAADEALYRAKQTGRNRVCAAGPVVEPSLA